MTAPRDDENNGLKPPRLPDVTRLNRNVLLVAGMGVAVVVLAVTHVVRSDRESVASRTSSARVEAGTMADFMRASPEADRDAPVPPRTRPDLDQAIDSSVTHMAARQQSPPTYEPHTLTAPSSAAYGSLPTRDPREEAYERALRAGLRSWDAGPRGVPTRSQSLVNVAGQQLSGVEADPLSTSDWLAQFGDAPASGVRPAAAMPAGLAGRGGASAPGDRYPALRESAGTDMEAPYVHLRTTEPISEYQIMAGTVFPAAMVTAMNSDMPGDVLAQISRDIYDSQQRHLLIPRGTKVLGRYDNQVALGQSRVLIALTRLIFPDGRSFSLPGLPTKDLRGAAGVPSHVNNHYARLYGQAALLSIIGAGAQLSQPHQSSVLAPASAGQIAAGALGQQLSQVSMETIRRNMDIRPTLEVKASTPFYIFLERDLVLDGPYIDRRASDIRSAAAGDAPDAARF